MLKYFLACGRWKTKSGFEREIKAGGTKRGRIIQSGGGSGPASGEGSAALFRAGSRANEEGLDGLGGMEEPAGPIPLTSSAFPAHLHDRWVSWSEPERRNMQMRSARCPLTVVASQFGISLPDAHIVVGGARTQAQLGNISSTSVSSGSGTPGSHVKDPRCWVYSTHWIGLQPKCFIDFTATKKRLLKTSEQHFKENEVKTQLPSFDL